MIKAKEIIIGENCHIGEDVEIIVRGKFELGKCSVILDGTRINCEEFTAGEYLFMAKNVEIGRGGSSGPESIVKIGDHVGIFENTVINPNSPVTIGNDVGIGAEVMIWTHGSWLDITKGFPADFGPVTIGNNVWLPARCIMLPNTSIGDNTVIGINSVITKKIPEGCLAAGIPCKVLKENVYPKVLSIEQKEKMICEILDYWMQVLVPKKGITSVTGLRYNGDTDCIEIDQIEHSTFFFLEERNIKGQEDDVTEDLRDFLRRRGIKFYTNERFKSINIQ
jgi:acetyltransferase-like isoleucine patch superfamily enzyme